MTPLPNPVRDASDQLPLWWERPDLRIADGELQFAGHGVADLTSWSDRPTFVYDCDRAIANIERVRRALTATGLAGEVLFAVKANRFAPFLTRLAHSGRCGVDVCSAGEIRAALAAGFPPIASASPRAGCPTTISIS